MFYLSYFLITFNSTLVIKCITNLPELWSYKFYPNIHSNFFNLKHGIDTLSNVFLIFILLQT